MKKSWSVFSRLLLYFLIVMSIPSIALFALMKSGQDQNVIKGLEEQIEAQLALDSEEVLRILDDYRHKAYTLSQDPVIIESVKNEEADKDFYRLLFDTMEGDNHYASAHIVSKSGELRASTHTFPTKYDARLNEELFSLTVREKLMNIDNPRKTVISFSEHAPDENGRFILCSVIRRILGESGEEIGYVIIDVYMDAVTDRVNRTNLFTEELIVDTDDWYALSLIHPTKYGSFNRFPIIKSETAAIKEIVIEKLGLKFMAIVDTLPYRYNMARWMTLFSMSVLSSLVVSIILALIFSHSLSLRIRKISNSMKVVEEGNLNITLSPTGLKEVDVLSSSFNVMLRRIRDLIDLTKEEEEKLREAERKQLESQLNPHFLFNTLNTIKALARIHGEEEIYTISLRLGKLLRSSLNTHTSDATIKESLELTESYLMIQKIRFKEKINYTIDVDESLMDVKTPKLVIQPFAENAIVHGLEPKTSEGHLYISIRRAGGDRIRMVIEDDGVGFDPSEIKADKALYMKEGHVGLWNTERRLRLHYGDDMLFDIESTPGLGTKVTIELPEKMN